MGPEVATLLLAGGTAAQMVAANQQQKDQRKILNQAFDRQQEDAKGATAKTLDTAQGLGAEGQKTSMQAAEDAAYQRTMADLEGADSLETAGQGGAVFDRARAERGDQEGQRLSKIARETAAVRAPAQVQQEEAMKRSALAEQLGSMFRNTQNSTQAAQLDAQNVDTPWYGDVGKIAALVGGASLGAGGVEAGGAAGATDAVALADTVYAGANTANTAASTNGLFSAASPMFSSRRKPAYGVVR